MKIYSVISSLLLSVCTRSICLLVCLPCYASVSVPVFLALPLSIPLSLYLGLPISACLSGCLSLSLYLTLVDWHDYTRDSLEILYWGRTTCARNFIHPKWILMDYFDSRCYVYVSHSRCVQCPFAIIELFISRN